MSAYAVFLRDKIRDPEEMKAYSAKVRPSFEGYDPNFLVRLGRHEVMEGPDTLGVVVIEFSDFETAKAWYGSAEYAEARHHRHLGGDYRCIIVEGV